MDDLIEFLMPIVIVFLVVYWIVEYVLPILVQGAILLGPSGGATWLLGKELHGLLGHCALTWKSRLAVWIWILVGLVVGIAAACSLQGWHGAVALIYAVPACLACIWLTFFIWSRRKTVKARAGIRKIQRRLGATQGKIRGLEQRRDLLRAELARKKGGRAAEIQARALAVARMEAIIRGGMDPRMLFIARDVLLAEGEGLNEQQLLNELVQVERTQERMRTEMGGLRLATLTRVLIDRRTGHDLEDVEKMENTLYDLESELSRVIPERDRLGEEIQHQTTSLQTQTITLD